MFKKIRNYFKDVYVELVQKTSWPSWPELQSSAIVVMIASVLIAIVVTIMDMFFNNSLEWFYDKLF